MKNPGGVLDRERDHLAYTCPWKTCLGDLREELDRQVSRNLLQFLSERWEGLGFRMSQWVRKVQTFEICFGSGERGSQQWPPMASHLSTLFCGPSLTLDLASWHVVNKTLSNGMQTRTWNVLSPWCLPFLATLKPPWEKCQSWPPTWFCHM